MHRRPVSLGLGQVEQAADGVIDLHLGHYAEARKASLVRRLSKSKNWPAGRLYHANVTALKAREKVSPKGIPIPVAIL